MTTRRSFVKRTNIKNRTNNKKRTKRINQQGGVIPYTFSIDNQDPIFSFVFHPTDPNKLAIGSCQCTDGRAKVYVHDLPEWLLFNSRNIGCSNGSPNGSSMEFVARPVPVFYCSVYSVAFHPTEPLLATGSSDKTAKLWRFSPDGSTATYVATLKGHSGVVSSVAFHPTVLLLATGSYDKTAKLWRFSPDGSTEPEPCVATLGGRDGHSDIVNSVAFHPTALLLATGSEDKTAKLWRFSSDGSRATCVATLAGHSKGVRSVAFHPKYPFLATGSDDTTAKLWRFSPDDSSPATCVATLEGHSKGLRSVAFHPKYPFLATGSDDTTAKLWQLSLDHSLANCVETLEGHSRSVMTVAFHPTAPLLATGSWDRIAKLYKFCTENKIFHHLLNREHLGSKDGPLGSTRRSRKRRRYD
jgi:hypothetical protein